MKKIFILLLSMSSMAVSEFYSTTALVADREWTRVADKKKVTAELVHVRGDVAVLLASGKLYAVNKSTLDTESIRLIESSKAPIICSGLLYDKSLDEVKILLGEPTRKSEKYLDYDSPGLCVTLTIQNERVVQVTASGDFTGVEDVRQRLGITFLSLGQMSKKGIMDRWFMASMKQGVWEVFCTPGDIAKYSLANLVLPAKPKK